MATRPPDGARAAGNHVPPTFQWVTSARWRPQLTGRFIWTPNDDVPRSRLASPVGSRRLTRGATALPRRVVECELVPVVDGDVAHPGGVGRVQDRDGDAELVTLAAQRPLLREAVFPRVRAPRRPRRR